MPYYKFGKNDLFRNTITTYPEVSFYIYGTKVYYQNQDQTLVNSNNPTGYANLYELNVNRAPDNLIFPWMYKDATLTSFKYDYTSDTPVEQQFTDYMKDDYGTEISGSYPMTASITTSFPGWGLTDQANLTGTLQLQALKNILNDKVYLTPHYAYSASYGDFHWDKNNQSMTLLNIPSIFYGSKIKKGTVKLEFFVSGSSIGQLVDKDRDGALYQVSGALSTNDGKVGGVVLYPEGIMLLTGSWPLSAHEEDYIEDGSPIPTQWDAFGRSTDSTPSSSYSINFSGSQNTSVITMMCHAPAGELNYSHNPTYIEFNTSSSAGVVDAKHHQYVMSSTQFYEVENNKVKNTVSSSFQCYGEPFKKQTFITKIGIYDDNDNLIGIANLARPVKKTENRDLTFKLKLDI